MQNQDNSKMNRSHGHRNGFTNGAVLSTGLTNGMGGRTNGMTNGLGGRTNGLTNGLGGRTNGLTNGLGGRTNGLTNGLGGRTNGMTNGLEGGSLRRGRRLDDRAISPSRISLVLIIAFIIMVPAFFFLLAYDEPIGEEGGMAVDGKFADWSEATIFADASDNSIASLDVIGYSAEKNEAGNMFIYAKASGNWFSTADVDSLLVFIDADENPSTGYSVSDMGAEYAVEVWGWGGEIKGRQMGIFAGNDQQNWSAWSWSSGVSAAMAATEIEVRTPRMTQLTTESKMRFMTKRGDGIADVCDAAITPGRGALIVRQKPNDANGIIANSNIMDLELKALGTNVEVTDIGYSSNVGELTTPGLPVTITAGQTITLQVNLTSLSSVTSGALVDVSVSTVTTSTIARVSILGEGLVAYAHMTPGQILIDGAFGDWNSVSKHNDIPLNDVPNSNTDIAQYAAANSTAKAFFYLKVADGGKVMGGSMVPNVRNKPTGTPAQPNGTSPTTKPKRVGGEDVARIYIDTKQGGQNIGGIGADYLVEIKGKNGRITSRTLYSLVPTRTFVANIEAANNAREMEIGVTLTNIGFTGNLSYFMESTDWKGNQDRTSVTTTISPMIGTRADGTFGGGDGSSSNPYLIEDAQDLQAMSGNLAAHYALANNIDASGTSSWNANAGFAPIGTLATPFTGTLHGRNHTISGLYIDRPTTDDVGLIGRIDVSSGTGSGTVKYLGLVNADITGDERVGGIVGYNYYGWVNNSYATGAVTGNYNVGGLAGASQCYISKSYADVTVQGLIYVGGLIGYNYGDLYTSYALGDVFGNSAVGGLIGRNDWKIYNSYSRGDVTRITGLVTTIGGFVGDNTNIISSCYSTGRVIYADATNPTDKGFAGANTGAMAGNYWDMGTSLQSTNAAGGATGKTTTEMMQQATFVSWDFSTIWKIEEDVTYPTHMIPEFHIIMLPMIVILGMVFLGRKNKRKAEEELDEEETEEIPDEESEEVPDEDLDYTEEIPDVDSEEEDIPELDAAETSDADDETAPTEIKKGMLIIGLILGIIGLAGIAGLRSGIIQSILGYSASPGIGSQEMMALAGSMVPLVIGLAFIGLWGVRNDPIYHQMEKVKEEMETEEPEEEAVTDDIEELDDVKGEITQEDVPEEFKKPIIEQEAQEPESESLDESIADLEKELEEKPEPKKGIVRPGDRKSAPQPEIRADLKKELDELDDDFNLELAKAEEEKRVQRCEKMLGAAVILPDDKQRLRALIPTGISLPEFTEELKTAVQRRKKKEEEKDVSSDEKASILEDELIAELGELADDLDDEDDEKSLEEDILKELDDLGEL